MDSTVLNVLPRGMSILVLAAGMIAQAPNGRANTVAQIAPAVRQALAPGEQEARRRGCMQIVVMTFSFQAPAFYERHGFQVVATIDDHPRGYQNLLMRKRLRPDS